MKKLYRWCLPALAILLVAFIAGFCMWRNVSRAPVKVFEVIREKPAGIIQVNINTATAGQLQTLPGIGPDEAQRIIRYRNENGPFSSVSQITMVEGIGISLLEEILDYITVEDQP